MSFLYGSYFFFPRNILMMQLVWKGLGRGDTFLQEHFHHNTNWQLLCTWERNGTL